MGLRFGRDVNAYTSYDETVYQVSLPTTQKQNLGLCAAEMATVDGWEEGGVFAWVSNTLGPRWGFAAISFGYLQIAIGFIPMLYFVLGALSYILKW